MRVAIISIFGVSWAQVDRPVDELARTAERAHSASTSRRSDPSTTALTSHLARRRIGRRWRGWRPPVANARRKFDSTILSPWPTTPLQELRAASFDGSNLKRGANHFDSDRDEIKLFTTGVRELMDAER